MIHITNTCALTVIQDIEINLPSRGLIVSGILHVGRYSETIKRVIPEEYFTLLLDNFRESKVYHRLQGGLKPAQ